MQTIKSPDIPLQNYSNLTTICHKLSLYIEEDQVTIINDLSRKSKSINEVIKEIIIDQSTNF